MERILVDLPEQDVVDLGKIAATEKVSRAEVIREAIAAYVARNKPPVVDAFGIWKGRMIDGLEYQERMRSEW